MLSTFWEQKLRGRKESEKERQRASKWCTVVINIEGGQGKHPMRWTMHSCGHTESLLCRSRSLYSCYQLLWSHKCKHMIALCLQISCRTFLQSYGLYYSHSEPDDKLLQINLFLKICGAFNKVYIKQAASCFSLLIMIPFQIQSLEVLQGMLLGFHSLD